MTNREHIHGYLGCRVHPKIREAIESLIPERYVSVSEFVLKAVVEKLKNEGITF